MKKILSSVVPSVDKYDHHADLLKTRLGTHFEIGAPLKGGTDASTFFATRRSDGKPVVIKVATKETNDGCMHLRSEILFYQGLSQLKEGALKPYFPELLGYFSEKGVVYFVLENVGKHNGAEFLKQNPSRFNDLNVAFCRMLNAFIGTTLDMPFEESVSPLKTTHEYYFGKRFLPRLPDMHKKLFSVDGFNLNDYIPVPGQTVKEMVEFDFNGTAYRYPNPFLVLESLALDMSTGCSDLFNLPLFQCPFSLTALHRDLTPSNAVVSDSYKSLKAVDVHGPNSSITHDEFVAALDNFKLTLPFSPPETDLYKWLFGLMGQNALILNDFKLTVDENGRPVLTLSEDVSSKTLMDDFLKTVQQEKFGHIHSLLQHDPNVVLRAKFGAVLQLFQDIYYRKTSDKAVALFVLGTVRLNELLPEICLSETRVSDVTMSTNTNNSVVLAVVV